MPVLSHRARVLTQVSIAALAVPLVLVACSSSKTTGSDSTGSAAAASSDAVLGTANKATGSPIVIGLSNPGKTPAIDTSDETQAAQAAVKYANDYLGGINGHVVQLKVCDTLGTPAQESDCANQMVQANVAANVQASGDDVTNKAMSAAKIPMFDGVGATQAALSLPGVFSMNNALSVYGTPASYAKEIGAKNAVIVVIDVPAASGPAQQLGKLFFANAGVAVDVVVVAPGTADMTPQIQAAEAKKPGLYYVLGDPPFCTAAFKAMKTLAVPAKLSMYTTCIAGDKGASIPGGYEGIKTATTQVLNPTDKEYVLFKAIQAKYQGNTDSQAAFGYAPVLGLIRALNAAKVAGTTAADAMTALQTAPAVPLPLGAGATFQCNGKALGLSKNVCSVASALADNNADGSYSKFELLNDPSIYKAPAS